MKKAILIISISFFYGLYSCNIFHKYFKTEEVLTIQPGSKDGIDAYIEDWPGENYPNRNWGNYDAFAAVAWTAQDEPLRVRSLLKFDLHKIYTKTPIKKATLSLYSVSTSGIGTGHSAMSGLNDFVLLKVTSPWDEQKVTWNTQPSYTEEDAIKLPATSSEKQDFVDIDVTKIVQNMINNSKKNYGIMIKLSNEEHYRRVIFGSSDNNDPMKRPKLVIQF
jgi:hypothetical protein